MTQPSNVTVSAENRTVTLTRIRFRRPVLSDTQTTHRTILTAIGPSASRILWAAPRRDLLFVQGDRPVHPAALAGVAEYRATPVRTSWDVGSQVTVSLIANVVQSVHRHGERGKRFPLPLEGCPRWLARKLHGALIVDDVQVHGLGGAFGRRADSTHMVHNLVCFNAQGHVVGSDDLERLMVNGVGPAKAYGAGLLLVSAV